MEKPGQKRSRTANYTNEEKLSLMNIISKFKNVIENKKTDSTTWRDKEIAWAKITTEFNARAPNNIYRDIGSLKKCYENKKKVIRKMASDNRKEVRATGGGVFIPKSDPCLDIVLDITNPKTVIGLENPCDGDGIQDFQEHDSEFHEEYDLSDVEIYFGNANEPKILPLEKPHTSTGKDIDWGNYKPDDLKTTPNRKLTANSWSSRRRPKVIQPVHTNHLSKQYSEVALLKKQYLEEELQNSKNKEKRDAEESALRKRALMLDIEIKELQLKRLKSCVV